MERIAEALGVSKQQISHDLLNVNPVDNQKRGKTKTHPEDLRDLCEAHKSKRDKTKTNPSVLRDLLPGNKSKRGKTKPDRNMRYRERLKDAKKSKSDRLRCYRVWMTDADVLALLDDWERPQQNQLTPRELHEHFDQQWMDVAGRVIALAALLAIRK